MVEIRTFGDGSYFYIATGTVLSPKFQALFHNIIPFAQVILKGLIMYTYSYAYQFLCFFIQLHWKLLFLFLWCYCELDVFDEYLNIDVIFTLYL